MKWLYPLFVFIGLNALGQLPTERIEAACVEILIDGHLDGSGCLIDSNGTILTAAHVLKNPGHRIEVRNRSMGRRAASVLAVDHGHDIATLQLSDRSNLPAPLPLAKQVPAVGTDVWVHGSPIYRHGLTLKGNMARTRLGFEYMNNNHVGCVYASGMSPGGTSGGPWFNAAGEVFGVQSGGMSINNALLGIAYIAPLAAVRQLTESREHARTPHLFCAFEEIAGQSLEFLKAKPEDLRGMVIRQVKEKSSAEQVRLHDEMIILKMNQVAYQRLEPFMKALRSVAPGEQVELEVINRFGKDRRTVTLKAGWLEERWASDEKKTTEAK